MGSHLVVMNSLVVLIIIGGLVVAGAAVAIVVFLINKNRPILKSCVVCHKEVSSAATMCPHCGQSLPTLQAPERRMRGGIIIVIGIILFIGLMVAIANGFTLF